MLRTLHNSSVHLLNQGLLHTMTFTSRITLYIYLLWHPRISLHCIFILYLYYLHVSTGFNLLSYLILICMFGFVVLSYAFFLLASTTRSFISFMMRLIMTWRTLRAAAFVGRVACMDGSDCICPSPGTDAYRRVRICTYPATLWCIELTTQAYSSMKQCLTIGNWCCG